MWCHGAGCRHGMEMGMNEMLLGVMIATAMLSLGVRDLLSSVILAGVFSLVSCLFYYVLGAPDVALTEAAVGTGIGSVVFIWIVYKTRGAGGDRADR